MNTPDQSCPICGGCAPKEGIVVSIDANLAFVDGRLVKLGPMLAPLLSVLWDRRYCRVSTDDLYAAIYGASQPETPTIYHFIRSLRSMLEGTSWQIVSSESGRRRGGETGYMLARVSHGDVDTEKLHNCMSALESLGIEKAEAADTVQRLLAHSNQS